MAPDVVDLARFLGCEIRVVLGGLQTLVPPRQVDDAIEPVATFENDTTGTIEATRLGLGHPNGREWKVQRCNSSLAFASSG